jgi:hypothetical protein
MNMVLVHTIGLNPLGKILTWYQIKVALGGNQVHMVSKYL